MIDELIEKMTLENLSFYMSEAQRDRIDCCGYSRKSGEFLKLRERLVNLPMPDFDVTMKTLYSLVDGKGVSPREKAKASRESQINASELYQSLDPEA